MFVIQDVTITSQLNGSEAQEPSNKALRFVISVHNK